MKLRIGLLLLSLLSAVEVCASPSAKGVFDSTYPNAAAVTSCFVCHTGTPGSRTAYGEQYVTIGGGTNTGSSTALSAIEGLDADNDGISNIDEINAGTLAPVSTPQNRGCMTPSIPASMLLFLLLYLSARRKRSA